MPLSGQNIEDASADIVALGNIVNGATNAPDVITRSGQAVTPVPRLVAEGREQIESILEGYPVGAALPLDTLTANTLTAYSETVSGRQAIVSPNDVGKEGLFSLLPAAPGAAIEGKISVDAPDGALFRTQSANGRVWARATNERVYDLRWWGIQNGSTDVQIPIGRALSLIEPFSKVIGVPGAQVEQSSGIVCAVEGTELDLRNMHFVHKTSVNPFNMLQIARSNCSVSNVRMTGKPGNTGVASMACIIFSHHASNWPHELNPMVNSRLENADLGNSSLPLVLYGHPRSDGVSPMDGFVGNNIRLASNFQLLSVFGADNVNIRQLFGRYFENPSLNNAAHQFACGIRILGSKEVDIEGRLVGGGRTHGSHDAVRITSANLGSFGSASRRRGENVKVKIQAKNFYNGLRIEECLGFVDATDCIFEGDPLGSELSYGVFISASGITSDGQAQRVGRIFLDGTKLLGYGCGVFAEGNVRYISGKKMTILRNSRAPNGPGREQGIFIQGLAGGTPVFSDWKGTHIISQAGATICVPNIAFGGHHHLFDDCSFGEGDESLALNGVAGIYTGSSLASAVRLRDCRYNPAGTHATAVSAMT